MTDLLVYETGTGGDTLLRGNDMATVNGYENSPYLSMFGGNKWWGNYLLAADNQYLANTEEALRVTPLTSSGRIAIERAVNLDLAYLKNITGTTYAITAAIAGPNRLTIDITINGKLFSYEWNPDELYLTYKVS